MTDSSEADFFNDPDIAQDLPGYLAGLRDKCPVHQESYQNVFMVTGYDEALEVFNQQPEAFSSSVAVTGPLPPLPFAPAGDIRGPVEYKRAMAAEMTLRSLRSAVARALSFA